MAEIMQKVEERTPYVIVAFQVIFDENLKTQMILKLKYHLGV